MSKVSPDEPQAPSPPPERGGSASVEMRLWQKRVGRNKRREAERIAPGGAAQCASLTAPYDFLRIARLTPTRRWRHSRCFASAFLVQSTAAEGRLCPPPFRGRWTEFAAAFNAKLEVT